MRRSSCSLRTLMSVRKCPLFLEVQHFQDVNRKWYTFKILFYTENYHQRAASGEEIVLFTQNSNVGWKMCVVLCRSKIIFTSVVKTVVSRRFPCPRSPYKNTLQIFTPWKLRRLGIAGFLQEKPALYMEKGCKDFPCRDPAISSPRSFHGVKICIVYIP